MMALPGSLVQERPSRRSQICARVARRTVLVQVRRSVQYQGERSAANRLTTIGKRVNSVARLQRVRPFKGLRVERHSLGPVLIETVHPMHGAGLNEGAILYLHGGGFVCGSLDSHRHVVARLARWTAMPVVHVEYRQHPQVTVDESVQDCLTAYRWLLEQGVDASRMVLAGDSAGGFLAFATVLAAQEQGLGVPAGVVGISPLLDLDCTARSEHGNAARDLMGVASVLPMIVDCASPRLDDRLALSPISGRLDDFPPTLIIVSESEALLCDAERMYLALNRLGRECTLRIWPGQLHAFPAMLPFLPESKAAVEDIARFVRTQLA